MNQLNLIIGSLSKVQILRAVLPLNSPFTGREAQRLGGIRSRAGVAKALEELSDLSILHRRELRPAHVYEVNTEHYLWKPLLDLFTVEAGLLSNITSQLRSTFEGAGIAEEVSAVVLFGSMARGDVHSRSDVDLLVLVRDQSSVATVDDLLHGEIVRSLRRRYGLELSAYVMSQQAAKKRRGEGDPLMAQIADSGRSLMGDSVSELFGGA